MGCRALISMLDTYVIKSSWERAFLNSVQPRPSSRCPKSRPSKDFQFDQPLSDSVREIVFGAPRRLDAADIRKVDRAVGLHARGRVQLRMVDDPDGDDVRSGQNAAAASRRRGPYRHEERSTIQIAGQPIFIVWLDQFNQSVPPQLKHRHASRGQSLRSQYTLLNCGAGAAFGVVEAPGMDALSSMGYNAAVNQNDTMEGTNHASAKILRVRSRRWLPPVPARSPR